MSANFLDTVLVNGSFDGVSLILCTACSLVLGVVCAAFYLYKNRGNKGFVVTLALIPLIVQMIILLVNGNLGTGVAVMGAFGLVRFRSLPGGAREIGAIFMAMAVGLATGTGFLGVAVLFVLVAGIAQLVLLACPLGEGGERERSLKITVPETLEYETAFDKVLTAYTDTATLETVKTSGMGSVFELKYHVRLRAGKSSKEFLDELRCRNGNLPIQLGHCDTREDSL